MVRGNQNGGGGGKFSMTVLHAVNTLLATPVAKQQVHTCMYSGSYLQLYLAASPSRVLKEVKPLPMYTNIQ